MENETEKAAREAADAVDMLINVNIRLAASTQRLTAEEQEKLRARQDDAKNRLTNALIKLTANTSYTPEGMLDLNVEKFA